MRFRTLQRALLAPIVVASSRRTGLARSRRGERALDEDAPDLGERSNVAPSQVVGAETASEKGCLYLILAPGFLIFAAIVAVGDVGLAITFLLLNPLHWIALWWMLRRIFLGRW